MTTHPLTRATLAAELGSPVPAPPVRMVHLGLGAFHRAHQAWYTQHASDGAEWGIAGFTGRGPDVATALAEQDGLYALVERGPEDDAVEIVTSIAEAHDGSDVARLEALLADPAVAVITLTVTEQGYRLGADGGPDLRDEHVAADIRDLSDAFATGSQAAPTTVLGRLLAGLEARRLATSAPIAIVPCDNIPANGDRVRKGLLALGQLVSPTLAAWIDREVAFVTTSVDRITPSTDAPVAAVVASGWDDRATVVTEPFSDWVLSGRFPAGRPAWETAGARFVDDIEPWENRKLWLLNGAHTILAAAGPAAGAETVADAIADPRCRSLVEAFWGEAVQNLPPDVEHIDYRRSLVERFANPRIVHRLSQIEAASTAKVRFRIVPVAERTMAAGRMPHASAAAIAMWLDRVLTAGAMPDAETEELRRAAASVDPVHALIAVVSPSLAADDAFVDLVRAATVARTSTTTS